MVLPVLAAGVAGYAFGPQIRDAAPLDIDVDDQMAAIGAALLLAGAAWYASEEMGIY